MASRGPGPHPPTNRRGVPRDAPDIPDHEVLRQIGHGSFGEVWLARAVTGVYRAVKVIHREDFEYERDFEREFEAIKRYEPISRQHPGLVHILQVGREDDLGIYYYIMEVADDLDDGPEFDPDTYTRYTFRSQLMGPDMLDLNSCIEHGANLAEALHFLHERDLIHRDVKLSNVIICDGVAKLADIGLVAALGDRSFVGTEGYVPPEGAGSASSDIFSLGMVIYELSTGKDRLDFPDVPTNFREIADPATWRQINKVVCRACARKVDDRYETAADMAQALRGQDPVEKRRWPLYVAAAAAIAVVGVVTTILLTRETPEPEHFDITSEPPGANVFAGEELLGETPLRLTERPQEGITFEIQLRGYNFEQIAYAGANDSRTALHVILEPSKFPQPGSIWENSLGLKFVPIPGGHRLDFPVNADLFLWGFAIPENRIMEGEAMMWEREGNPFPLAVVSARESRAFAEWMQAKDLHEGFIGPDYTYRALPPEDTETETWPRKRFSTNGRQTFSITSFVVVVGKQRYGSVEITSEPEGAEIYTKGGELVGMTPHSIPRARTGPVSYEIRLEGFKPHYLDGAVVADGLLELKAELEAGEAVEFGKPWINSIGMDFSPVGEQLLVSKFETRVRDYEQFCMQDEEHSMPKRGHATQAFHPVDAVSREDAEAFCKWLTQLERANNFITIRHVYRLPTDVEWSQLAGLPGEPGTTPAMRNGSVEGVYPWGYEWPPSDQSGNYSDESRARDYRDSVGIVTPNAPGPTVIGGYDDGFPQLAWVNEFRPNRYELFQVSGNVWEWVSDNFSGGGAGQAGTIRGGSWETAARGELLSSYRRSLSASAMEPGVGFRVVLSRVRNGN